MNIVILGAGEIGRHIASHLSEKRHEIRVIESDEELAGQVEQHLDGKVICGDGSLASVLLEASVGRAELFLACTSCNNTNLVSCAIAKELGAMKTICRVHPSVEKDELMLNRRELFNIDHLFSSERLAVIELAKTIRNPESLVVEEMAQGKIELQQVEVSHHSKTAGQNLRDLALPDHFRVAYISRAAEHLVPGPDDRIQPGDVVTIVGNPRDVRSFAHEIRKGIGRPRETSVVILGGGQYGAELARVLQAGSNRIRIFEKDQARCEDLKKAFGREATIIHADATDLSSLKEEQVGDASFFVATLADDADNVMACLQASDLGAAHTLTLLHRADYAAAIQHFSDHSPQVGIDRAVSPREAALSHLLRFVTSDSHHVLRTLDTAELIEANVAEGSSIAGKQVSEISWPHGSVLVGHIHGLHAEVPNAETVLEPGNNILAMVSTEAKKKFVKLLSK